MSKFATLFALLLAATPAIGQQYVVDDRTTAKFTVVESRLDNHEARIARLEAAAAGKAPDAKAPPVASKPGCKCDPCDCDDCECGLKVDPRRSVVKIAVFGAGATDLGSGTVIASANGKSLILTNAHVVESGEYPIEVYHKDASGKAWTHKAKYVGGSQVIHTGPGKIEVNGPDLALLEIDDELPAVEIATDKPTYGSTVRQFGFGGMGGYTQFWPKKGQIVESNYVERELASFQSIPGDSGSGWFNDAGQLVAVCCSTPGAGSGEALAVPVYQVQGFVVQSAGNRLPLFPRLAALKQRMQARRAAPVELAPQAPQSTAPKAQAAPPVFATPCPTCPNGRCPTQPAFGGYYVFPGRR